jgi:hypothetical protein
VISGDSLFEYKHSQSSFPSSLFDDTKPTRPSLQSEFTWDQKILSSSPSLTVTFPPLDFHSDKYGIFQFDKGKIIHASTSCFTILSLPSFSTIFL